MDDVLCEVSGEFELGDELVGEAELSGEVLLFEMAFLFEYLLNLLRQGFVALLLSIEELGALGGIVDDLGYLGRER